MKGKFYNFFALGIDSLGLTPHIFLHSLQELLHNKAEKGQQALNILFLCKGNICRSPYAEQKLLQLLQEHNILDVQVQSAGLETTPGKPADRKAHQVAKKRSVELSGHKTKMVNLKSLKEADLVFVMEPAHLWFVRKNFLEIRKKTFLLGALALSKTKAIIIRDPFAGSEVDFTRCFEQIDAALKKLVEILHGKS